MKFQTKYNILLFKSYFDKGLGLTSMIKYPLGFFAISSMNVKWTMILAVFYVIFCWILGWGFFKYDWVKAEIEIGNKYNLFIQEMRKKVLKSRNS